MITSNLLIETFKTRVEFNLTFNKSPSEHAQFINGLRSGLSSLAYSMDEDVAQEEIARLYDYYLDLVYSEKVQL